jgi:hypothetical protein
MFFWLRANKRQRNKPVNILVSLAPIKTELNGKISAAVGGWAQNYRVDKSTAARGIAEQPRNRADAA